MSDLARIRIVLVETSHPGNIGSTARAMKTMGLSNLVLVNPKAFLHEQAHAMAAGADDIMDNARVCHSLDEALLGASLVLGTSARPRDLDLKGLTPEQAAIKIAHQTGDVDVAILFGREHAGLTNEELMHCHYHIQIPANPLYSSLNLSQAVQVQCYELRKHCLKEQLFREALELAAHEDVELFFKHLEEVLTEIDFLKKSASPARMMQRVRRLFNRSGLEPKEVNFLRGMLTQIQQKIKHHHKE